jgi:D-lyxose ketol-isomerase
MLCALLGVALLAGCAGPVKRTQAPRFDNASFYDAKGKFDPERAKDAYLALMRYHGYPVFDGAREKLWVSDYGTGQFARLGLGALMFQNQEEHLYMLMDLYLLPNQMLPEHWHEKPEGTKPVKLEGWLVRHGSAHIVGEGEPSLPKEVVIPPCHQGGTASVQHAVLAKPGDFVGLNRATAHHWMCAGPQGAILSEVANLHVNPSVRHADPAINAHFLAK